MNWFIIFFKATLVTLSLTIFALFLGFFIALIMTYIKYRKIKTFVFIVDLVTYVIRGTPILLQLFIIYHGLPHIPGMKSSFFWPIIQSPWFCAVFTLALNTGAYSHYLFYGGLNKLSSQHSQSGLLLGLTPAQTFRKILFPQVLKNTWSGYQNEIYIMLKSSALASTITLMEITGTTRMFVSQTYQTLEGYALAGVLYLSLSLMLWLCTKKIAKYLLKIP